jgi:hypothetical protein
MMPAPQDAIKMMFSVENHKIASDTKLARDNAANCWRFGFEDDSTSPPSS